MTSFGRALTALTALVVGSSAPVATADSARNTFLETAKEKCRYPSGLAAESSGKLVLRDRLAIGYASLQQNGGDTVRVYDQNPRSGERIFELFQRTSLGTRAAISLKLDRACALIEGREIEYDANGHASAIIHLDRNSAPTGQRDELNPPVPTGRNHAGVKVALIDSGVNYLISAVAQSLARDSEGKILGFDFREMDDRPFDSDPVRFGPFAPARHGTSVASILLSHGNGNISLVPYSFPANDPRRFHWLVEDMRRKDIKIANMSIGSAELQSEKAWKGIANAIASAPEILFVVAAGNEGRNIDSQPVYPASFNLPNVLVVGAVDASGRVSVTSNYGSIIDVAAVADPVSGKDFLWQDKSLTGTSFAAPQVAALVAGVLKANPGISPSTLKTKICSMAKPVVGQRHTACGYISFN